MSWLDDLGSALSSAFGDDSGSIDLTQLDPDTLTQLGITPGGVSDPTSPYSNAFSGAQAFGSGVPAGNDGINSGSLDPSTAGTLNSIGYGTPGVPSQYSPDEMNSALQQAGYTPSQIAAMSPGFLSSLGDAAAALGKSLGINSLGQLIPLAAALGTGIYGSQNTKAATAQTVAAINAANTNLGTTAGQIQSSFSPYQGVGNTAMQNIANSIGTSNLGSPNGRALSSMVPAISNAPAPARFGLRG